MGRSSPIPRRASRHDGPAPTHRCTDAARETHTCGVLPRRRAPASLSRPAPLRPPAAGHRRSIALLEEDAGARSRADRSGLRCRRAVPPPAQAQERGQSSAPRPGRDRRCGQHLRGRVALPRATAPKSDRQHGQQAIRPQASRIPARVARARDRQSRQLGGHISRRVGRGRRATGEAARLWSRGRTVLHVRAAAERDPDRRPDDSFLPALPALVPRLVAIAILGAGFIALTIAIAAGAFTSLDMQVAQGMHDPWQPSLHLLFQPIAELGSIERTTVVMLGLTIYLWRSGFGSDALVFIVFVAAQAFELYYKWNLYHPQPPRSLAESDGPSISMLFAGTGAGNSFPSGHVLRAVIVYGLLAFVIRRLAVSQRIRALAAALAVAVIALVSIDRLYLDVHWESDVVGGLILGGNALVAGPLWLDPPREAGKCRPGGKSRPDPGRPPR